MANASYTAFKKGILNAEYDLDTAVLKVALVRTYTFAASHATMADVTGAGGVINGTSGALTGCVIAGGIFDADDTSITTTASAAAHYLIVYQASAVTGGADVAAASQKLLFYFDTGTNLPVNPGTGTLTISWPNTTARIYKIG